MALTLSSPKWRHGATIPKEHTGDGADISPPLVFEGIPPGTSSSRSSATTRMPRRGPGSTGSSTTYREPRADFRRVSRPIRRSPTGATRAGTAGSGRAMGAPPRPRGGPTGTSSDSMPSESRSEPLRVRARRRSGRLPGRRRSEPPSSWARTEGLETSPGKQGPDRRPRPARERPQGSFSSSSSTGRSRVRMSGDRIANSRFVLIQRNRSPMSNRLPTMTAA